MEIPFSGSQCDHPAFLSACSSAAPPLATETPVPATPTTEQIPLLTITFRNGTCEYDGPVSVNSFKVRLKVLVNEDFTEAANGVAVAAVTLQEGKGVEDLQAWTDTVGPPWATNVDVKETRGQKETEFTLYIPEETFYFACILPDREIGAVGPVYWGDSKPPADEEPMLSFIFRNGTCDYDGPSSVPGNQVKIKMVLEERNEDAMQGVAVVAATLDEGKSLQDLQEWPTPDKPDWANIVNLFELSPGSLEKEFTLRLPKEPVYFACFYPDAKIGAHGPLTINKSADTAQAPVSTPIPRVAPTASPNPFPIIIDTDMAVDDWMAILYLLNRTDVAVQAITVTGAGEAHCGPGVENALRLVHLAGKSNIPVACGRETPLEGDHTFPEEWRTHVDSFAGQDPPAAENPNTSQDAVALLQSILTASTEPVTILTLGPITNIASLLRTDPEISGRVEMVYVMGGAVNVPGNLDFFIDGNEAAEWNIYVDPMAAQEMLASGIPVTLIPLDATNQVPLTLDFYDRLEVDHPEAEAAFVYDVLTSSMGMIQSDSYYFWDPLAAGILADESIATIKEMEICIDTTEGPTSGATQVKAGCPTVRVAIDADQGIFEYNFIEALNAP